MGDCEPPVARREKHNCCNSCDACAFVSFSKENNDCSWYKHCAMHTLVDGKSDTYATIRVRGPARGSDADDEAV